MIVSLSTLVNWEFCELFSSAGARQEEANLSVRDDLSRAPSKSDQQEIGSCVLHGRNINRFYSQQLCLKFQPFNS
jgi:hypothetical protein